MRSSAVAERERERERGEGARLKMAAGGEGEEEMVPLALSGREAASNVMSDGGQMDLLMDERFRVGGTWFNDLSCASSSSSAPNTNKRTN